MTIRSLKCVTVLALVVVLFSYCKSKPGTSLKQFQKGVTQLPADVKPYFKEQFDAAFVLTNADSSRIIWLEKYKNAEKEEGLESSSGYFANELVVKLKDSQPVSKLKALLGDIAQKSNVQFSITDSIPQQHVYELTASNKEIVELANLKADFDNSPLIAYSSPNYIAFFDQYANQEGVQYNGEQWAYRNYSNRLYQGGVFDADADGLEALSKYTYWRNPKTPILIGVMDSGCDITHPALRPVIYVNSNEIPNNNIDDDHNGKVDDVSGWNFRDNNNSVFDEIRHGTHVSGIIGAQPIPSNKMRGIYPDAKILPVKTNVEASGISKLFDDANALYYCMAMQTRIVNMSFGTTNDFTPFRQAIADAVSQGLLIVASAGNDTRDLQTYRKYPACYAGVITVANTTRFDVLAPKSNFDSFAPGQFITIAAPGDYIYSTVPGGQYAFLGGTSMSAPLVAGTLAMLKSLYPTVSNVSLINKIRDAADIVPSLNNKVPGQRRLNIYRAIFQPAEERDANGIPYRDQIVGGQARGNRIPYANSGDPGITGIDLEHAYKISTMQQLMNIRDEDLDKHFLITNNLDYANMPPGTPAMIDKSFNGYIYGQGYTIFNINIQTGGRAGLFRNLGDNANISNLRFACANVKGKSLGAGIIAATANKSELYNVQVEGNVTADDRVGGLIGQCFGVTMKNCYFEGTVTGVAATDRINYVGGLVGLLMLNSSIKSSHATVQISGVACGGIAGASLNSVVEECHANSLIKGPKYLGGLIGMAGSSTITNCSTEGLIDATVDFAGGLIGDVSKSRINNCYAFCGVVGGQLSGGLLGRGADFSVTGSYFWTTQNQDGAGGIPTEEYALMQRNNFVGWWNTGTPWAIIPGFRPSITMLPRAGVSLY